MSLSIQDRINALNIGHVRSGPPPPKPPPSNKPALPPRLPPRSVSTHDIHTDVEDSSRPHPIGNQPSTTGAAPPPPVRPERSRLPLPPPRVSAYPAKPPLPARNSNDSQALVRRDSSESVSSTISARSSLSTPSTHTSLTSASTRSPSIDNGSAGGKNLRVPMYDPNALPPLPPKRTSKSPLRPELKSRGSSASTTRAMPPRPPTLPPRQSSGPNTKPPPAPARRESAPVEQLEPETPPPQPPRPRPAPQPSTTPKRSALSYGMNNDLDKPPAIPETPADLNGQAEPGTAPPPIPMSSRPNLAALQASKPKPSAAATSTPKSAFNTVAPSPAPPSDVCMRCRDFSGPDNHAARFPRESIPSTDVAWLANQLTAPFPSHTDKARALFTWCHHNIAYDCAAFFANNIKKSTPSGTIERGMGVCEGYAGLYNALALAAGLECVVITGHGAGLMKRFYAENEAVPPYKSNHAWNVVKIDGGQWKLIDACWGAGNVSEETQSYTKAFKPEEFTKPNEEFGFKHFPTEPAHQFRSDGRTISWEYYMRGGDEGSFEKVTVYTGAFEEHGLDDRSFVPRGRYIKVRGAPPNQRIQFQFKKYCPHWNMVKKGQGRPYQMVLAVGGRDGRDKKHIPIRTNGSDWWCDVATQELGTVGQSIHVYAIQTIDGKNVRGITLRDYEQAVGRKGMSWIGVAQWQLT